MDRKVVLVIVQPGGGGRGQSQGKRRGCQSRGREAQGRKKTLQEGRRWRLRKLSTLREFLKRSFCAGLRPDNRWVCCWWRRSDHEIPFAAARLLVNAGR